MSNNRTECNMSQVTLNNSVFYLFWRNNFEAKKYDFREFFVCLLCIQCCC